MSFVTAVVLAIVSLVSYSCAFSIKPRSTNLKAHVTMLSPAEFPGATLPFGYFDPLGLSADKDEKVYHILLIYLAFNCHLLDS